MTGFSKVLKYKDRKTSEIVAVKQIPVKVNNKDTSEMALNEVKIL